MSKKTKTPAVKKVKNWKFILSLSPSEQKQLEIVHKMTAEKTATKAIIKSMYQAEYYMKRYQEEQSRVEVLQAELYRYKDAVSSFTSLLKVMNELNSSKSVANTSTQNKGKKGLQLIIEDHE